MCAPLCQEAVARHLSRRSFLATAAAATAAACLPSTVQAEATKTITFSKIIDLTHRLSTDFPTFTGQPQFSIADKNMGPRPKGYHAYTWTLAEHTGTHMDAPLHFGGKQSADQLPITDLYGPLAIIDIRAKAKADPDARLTPDDIHKWEKNHGPLPVGGILAMFTGWELHVTTDKFRNADAKGVMHFPGFHEETPDFLLKERQIKGICVDTLSLDYGPTADFPVHCRWLGAGRWGMECVARLGSLPPTGATLIAAGPMIAGASGGPSRVLALV